MLSGLATLWQALLRLLHELLIMLGRYLRWTSLGLLAMQITSPCLAADPQAPVEEGAAQVARTPSPVALELQERIANRTVRELRTCYDGDYGTTLMLADDQVLYYVGFLHGKELWRVFKFKSIEAAENAYRQNVQLSASLAAQYIKKQVSVAQRREADTQAQRAATQLEALNSEISNLRQQRRAMAVEQNTMRVEAQGAAIENHAAQLRLEQLQHQVQGVLQQLNQESTATLVPANPR